MDIQSAPVQHLHPMPYRTLRTAVKIMAEIRVSGGIRNRVRITDLSQTGFMMECLTYIPVDRPIFVSMPGLAQLVCDLVWRSDWRYGCVFAAPLPELLFDHLVTTYPAHISDRPVASHNVLSQLR